MVRPFFFQKQLNNVFFELQAPFWVGLSKVKTLQQYWGLKALSKKALIENYRDLSRENAYLRVKNLELAHTYNTNKARWSALLKLPCSPRFEYSVARVCKRSLTTWNQSLIISKGHLSGLKEGYGVISSNGAVGVISNVHAYTSEVTLITNKSFRTVVCFEGSKNPMLYNGNSIDINLKESPLDKGRFFRKFSGKLLHAPLKLKLKSFKRIVTSSMGNVFPPGITVGWVKSLKEQGSAPFQIGTVALGKYLYYLDEVAVAIPVSEACNHE